MPVAAIRTVAGQCRREYLPLFRRAPIAESVDTARQMMLSDKDRLVGRTSRPADQRSPAPIARLWHGCPRSGHHPGRVLGPVRRRVPRLRPAVAGQVEQVVEGSEVPGGETSPTGVRRHQWHSDGLAERLILGEQGVCVTMPHVVASKLRSVWGTWFSMASGSMGSPRATAGACRDCAARRPG